MDACRATRGIEEHGAAGTLVADVCESLPKGHEIPGGDLREIDQTSRRRRIEMHPTDLRG